MNVRNSVPQPASRSGATLTEVLMSILIMSIGVVSVITLFPLAILRAVHATQLTNSKVLENNIEDFINTNTWMLRGSPVDPKLVQPADGGFLTACAIDPLGEQFMGSFSTKFGNQGGTAPTWAIRRISPFKQFTPAPSYLTTGNTDWSLTERGWADQGVCSLPDSWTTIRDDLPTAITTSSVTFQEDLGATAGDVRLTLVSLDETKSVSRLGTMSGQTFTKKTTEPNLPTAFSLANVSRAIVEANEPRYTWVITCPASGTSPAASCAVFFRRGYDPDEEFIYANSGSAPLTVGSPVVTVTWDTSTNPTPLLREGNFLFDAEFALWYRIRSYSQSVSGTTGTATIDLDQPAIKAGRGIVLPHGLVDVFDVELRGQQ